MGTDRGCMSYLKWEAKWNILLTTHKRIIRHRRQWSLIFKQLKKLNGEHQEYSKSYKIRED